MARTRRTGEGAPFRTRANRKLRRTEVHDENIEAFRARYRIPEPVFTFPFPFNPLYHVRDIGSVDMMPFWTKAIMEGG